MKSLLFIAVGMILSIASVNAQTPLNKIKLDKKMEDKLSKTVVGMKLGDIKGEYKVDTQSLATKMPDGEKIIAYNIVYWEDQKTYYLARKYKIEKDIFTNLIPLLEENGQLCIARNSPYPMQTCKAHFCESCGDIMAGSQKTGCSCEAAGPDDACINIFKGGPDSKIILERLFN